MRLPRQNQYPRAVVIGQEVYTIKWVNHFRGDSNQVGECCWTTKVIRIKRGQSPADRLKTYVHEVIHALECEHELKLPHKLVYSLEEAVYQFLVENF